MLMRFINWGDTDKVSPQWILFRFILIVLASYLVLFIGFLILLKIEVNAFDKADTQKDIEIRRINKHGVMQDSSFKSFLVNQEIQRKKDKKHEIKQDLILSNVVAFQDTQRIRRVAADKRVDEWKKYFELVKQENR